MNKFIQIIFIILTLWVSLFVPTAQAQIKISETTFQKRLHYKVEISNATFLIDKYSGGISSLTDKQGKDWIQWKRLAEEKYPESAAGDFRGMPNFVYGGDDNGTGHPGFEKVMCFKDEENRIRIKSLNGKWEWQYEFFRKYMKVQVLSTPASERNYWFLYEGVPGGEFNPERQYWGTHKGLKTSMPDYYRSEEEYGKWDWVFFGHQNFKRVLFLVQKRADKNSDTFGFLGDSDNGLQSEDGMVVFGFGRGRNATPLLNSNQIFYVGFYEKLVDSDSFSKLALYIQKTIF
ncbi:hypothetical protein GM418_26810 [Maribellus comscasis]|uniref:Uncharacterized protein n=1 Tax=Maribellus comscasis TaxID=2681766 RepID=A0A6I6K673_9BACT|nr:hypothetical protein [Maribellus comscasis]QGY47143.1 hypothetical protein GM418_26810 [Maribellus comscasis]